MNSQERLFAIEQDDQTLILSPIANLNELELSSLDDAIRAVMQQLGIIGIPQHSARFRRDGLLRINGAWDSSSSSGSASAASKGTWYSVTCHHMNAKCSN